MAKSKREYGNESISMLEGADRVRKRPGGHFRLGRAGGLRARGV